MTKSIQDWISRLSPDVASAEQPSSQQAAPLSSGLNPLLLSVSRPAMACEFEVLLNQHQYAQATEAAVQALELVSELENLLSVYKPRSDLSTLNRFGPLRSVLLSHDALTLLELAQDAHHWTHGAFDITAGTLSEAWGFSRRKGRMPSDEEIATALSRVGSHRVVLDPSAQTAQLDAEEVQVNPGGIGKGYALDRATQRLVAGGVSDFMLHGGMSSVVARGHRDHPDTGGGWLVSLKHPWRWEEHLGTIRLRDAALATSGSGKQFFHFKGQRYSHIIDPRTGWPAQGVMSATVVCQSAAIADVLATAFFVMGREAVEEFCSQHREISAVLIFVSPNSGKQSLETFNMDTDAWQPR